MKGKNILVSSRIFQIKTFNYLNPVTPKWRRPSDNKEQEVLLEPRLRITSSRVPVKMSEQAGRERSGGLETSRQKLRLSVTQRPKVRDDRTRLPARGHRQTGECSGRPLRRSHGAQLGCSPRKKEGNGAECAAPRQGRVRHLVPEVAPKLRRQLRADTQPGGRNRQPTIVHSHRDLTLGLGLRSERSRSSADRHRVRAAHRALADQPQLFVVLPLSSHPPLLLRVCLLAKPAVRMRVTMALLFCRKKTQLGLFEFLTTSH